MRSFPVLAHHFAEGGTPMYWVLTCSILVMGIVLRKLFHLYGPRPSSAEVLARLDQSLSVGDLGRAVSDMLHSRGELAYVAVGALASALHSDARVEAALAERLVLVRAPLRRGIGMLFRLSQLATLFGLLGAVLGLQTGYCSSVDAHSRATMLAAGISESMTPAGVLASGVPQGSGRFARGPEGVRGEPTQLHGLRSLRVDDGARLRVAIRGARASARR